MVSDQFSRILQRLRIRRKLATYGEISGSGGGGRERSKLRKTFGQLELYPVSLQELACG